MDVVQQDLYMFFSLKISRDFKILNYISAFETEKKNESKVNENVEAEKMFLIFFFCFLVITISYHKRINFIYIKNYYKLEQFFSCRREGFCEPK